MDFLPSVVEASYEGGFRVQLTFNDETEGVLDLQDWLEGPIFEPLKDRAYFRTFFLDGGTLSWPNGADIAPETLYEALKQAESASGPQVTADSERPQTVAREEPPKYGAKPKRRGR